MSLGHGPAVVKTGLVLHLDAANLRSYTGTGTAWKDLSGSGRHASLTNGPTHSISNNGNFTFDGVNDYAVVTSPYYTFQKQITVSAWVKFNTFEYVLSQAVKDVDNMSNNVWLWHKVADGIIWYVNDNGTWVSVSYAPLVADKWCNIVTVASEISTLIYVNAEQKASGSAVSTQILNVATSEVATNDNRYSTSRPPHNGNIGNIKIYNRALSIAEIKQNFEATRGRYGI